MYNGSMRPLLARRFLISLGLGTAYFLWRSSPELPVPLPTPGTTRMVSRLREVIRRWEIRWPASRAVQTVRNVQLDQVLEVVEDVE